MRRSLVLIAAAAAIAACATSPLGRKQLRFFPDAEVDQMGVAAFDQTKQQTPPDSDPTINAYVDCVAKAITAELPNGPKSWEVTVFNKDEANAFALPGGKIGVYTGIFKYAKTPDELAAVIGHETGHVMAKHANERISTAYATQTGLQLIEAMAGGNSADKQNLMSLLGLGAQVGVILPFSRTQEAEADIIGLDLMAKAGFDPRAAVELWNNMSSAGGQPPEILSTHPANKSRIQDIQNHLSKEIPIYEKARREGKMPNCHP